ncbi:hypothetical protein PCANC_09143 [Puccinia coronata f. sp. avenae]|uniref:Uncharacterized protein n=1 Tax=Puccinia coronata f. sp. avenae TaxID=200324 RepID=A0A2N5T1H3_9BASI|nr:hypothetical protein PCANC_09143 [Puccinia coronata f. sp. avenae]
MAITDYPQRNSNESDTSTSALPPRADPSETVSRTQSHPSPSSPSFARSHQMNVLEHNIRILRSPIISNQVSSHQPMLTTSLSELGSNPQEAGPLPEKVGEIGYVPPAEPIRPPNVVTRASSQQTEPGIEAPALSQYLRPARSMSSWTPTQSGSNDEDSSGSPSKPRERITAFRMFFKPILLVTMGLVVISVTFVGLIQVQDRINSSNKNHHAKGGTSTNDDSSRGGNHDDSTSGNTEGGTEGSVTNSASFVYMGTFFIVALLVEIWIFVGSLRRVYHRLGLWVDQEYSPQLSDLSDPDDTIQSPALPWWAKALGIKPQVVRKPLLPSYMAVLGIIRTGGRSGTNQAVDVEDGEVIRSLAIGQGQAAPAFNGEEFQRSTVILSGPPKRNSTRSNSPSIRSGGLLDNLSRTLTGGFSSSDSTTQTTEINPTTRANRRISETSIISNGRQILGAHFTISETAERVSNENSTTVELYEVPVSQCAAYIHQPRRVS